LPPARPAKRREAGLGDNGGVKPATRFRKLALSFPETYEDSPWGHPVFKVGANKMFATMGNDEPRRVTVKLAADERQVALELPFVEVAAYVGRYGWVTATIEDAEALEAALEWLRDSYYLNAPATCRDAAYAD
jgi:predicted DNA-binding protein (MmcQ/YjbR family)